MQASGHEPERGGAHDDAERVRDLHAGFSDDETDRGGHDGAGSSRMCPIAAPSLRVPWLPLTEWPQPWPFGLPSPRSFEIWLARVDRNDSPRNPEEDVFQRQWAGFDVDERQNLDDAIHGPNVVRYYYRILNAHSITRAFNGGTT